MLKQITSGAALLLLSATLVSQATPAFAITDAELATAQSEKESTKNKIKDLESKLNDLTGKTNELTKKKETIESEAKKLDSDIKTLNEEIKERHTALSNQARSAQTSTNSGSTLETLLNSKSLTDAIQKVTAIKQISDANTTMLNDQKDAKKDLEKKSKALQDNYGKYLKLSTDIEQQTKDANVQKAELELATAKYEATIAKAQAEKDAYLKKAEEAKTKVESAKKEEATYNTKLETAVTAQTETSNIIKSEQTITTPTSSNSGSVWDYRSQFMTSSSAYNGYAGGGCTDYVWQYFAARGVYIPNVMPGNGKDWAYQMPAAPKVVPGVIASFAAGAHGSSSVYGHVAVVEEVYPDGSFKVSEGGAGIWGSTRIIPNQSGVTFVLP